MLKRHSSRIITMVALLLVVALVPANALAEQSLIAVQELTGIEAQGYTRAGYYDLNNNWQSRSDARQLSSSMHTLDGGWWVVGMDKAVSQRLKIIGDTNLILGSGHTLKAENGICINPGATLTIWTDTTNAANAGAIIASSESLSGIGSHPRTVGGTLIINGGNIKATGGNRSAGIGGSEEGRLTSITINKGSVEATGGQGGAGIGSGYKADSCPVIINGGEVKANGGKYGAGIGGGQRIGTVGGFGGGCTINGGTVTATGGEHGAGIGGGKGTKDTGDYMHRPYHENMTGSGGITITAGTVTATGGASGAGIGGGMRGYADGLTFSGGTVIATAGELAAGIGGGQFGESTEITINGGTITAKACDNTSDMEHHYSGAAIGSGWRADFMKEMVVSGGKVIAIGAIGGAGIGAGSQGNMTGKLTITGGEVYAYGGRSGYEDVSADANRGGAGIGGGEEVKFDIGGEGGTVDIQGGKVVACAGGGWRCAIGHGYNDSVMGNLSIADSMWVRWTNTVTLGAKQGDGTYNEPTVDMANLTPAWTPNRVSDCQHMRYVVIEKCQHNAPSVSCIDTTVREHTLNSDCPYCGEGHAGALANHDFTSGSESHTCVCGHKERAVTFYNEDGSVYVPTDYYVEGTTITRPEFDPTREGFTFLGWFRKIGDNEYAPRPYNFSLPMGDSDINFYAKWKKDVVEHKVEFYDDDDKLLQTKQVEDGQKVAKPDDPAARADWTFNGWYEMEEGQYKVDAFNFDTEVMQDYKLYQKWTPAPEPETLFTVTFDSKGHGSTIPAQQVSEGGRVKTKDIIPTLGTAEEGQWLFAGWYTDEACTQPYDFSSQVADSFTLYAKWVERDTTQNYYVTFDPNGGVLASGTVSPQMVEVNKAASKPADPTREGWSFSGWQLNGADYDWSATVTADITLVATWKQVCTVTFASEGGTDIPEAQKVVAGNKAAEPDDPARTGYSFEGWYLDGFLYDFDEPVENDLTLEAYWVQMHTVHFDSQGGSSIEDQVVDHGNYISLEGIEPTRGAGESEWLFAGWYKEAACTNPYEFSPVEADLTLYAKWVPRDTTVAFTVSFDPSGGIFASDGEGLQVVEQGEKAAKPVEPTREGFTFAGWYLGGSSYDFDTSVTRDITLTARWEKLYTVSYDSAGGTAVGPQQVVLGSRIPKPADPTREGYTLEGWFLGQTDDAAPWDFENNQVLDDLTLTARWKTNKHVVTFDPANGSDATTQEVADGETATRPAEPTRAGYQFAGWYLDESSYGFDMPVKDDITLTARWAKLCTVRYDSAGGTAVPPLQVVSGSKLTRPADPVRGNLEFLGWYMDLEDGTSAEWVFEEFVVEDDLVLEANWLVKTHTVTFDTQGGSEVEPQEVDDGARVRKGLIAEPTKEGSIFVGWFTTSEGTVPYDFSAPVTSDVTVYAKWVELDPDPGQVTVVFDSDGGSYIEPQQITAGGTVTKPDTPTREYCTFGDWYLVTPEGNMEEGPYDFFKPINSDITLRASWDYQQYEVSFELEYEGSDFFTPESQTVNYGYVAQQPPEPVRDGYLFAGWYQKDGETLFSNPYDFSTPVTQVLHLYADWLKVNTVHTVAFDSNGGSPVESQAVDQGESAKKPTDPTRSGYKFLGWYADAKFSQAYDFSAPVNGDLTVYAKWLKVHSVSFETSGGTKVDAQSVDDGDKVFKPSDPTRSGYKFLGWYGDAGLTKAYDFSAPVEKDLTIYAKWLKVHSVSFAAAGGTKVAAQSVDDGNKASKPSDPARSGYKFLGWYADAKLAKAYDFSAPVKEDLTIYAKWLKVHSVSFDTAGGSKVDAQSVDDGDKASKPSDPTRGGYKFLGWYADAKLSQAYDFSAPVNGDLTVYAKWVKVHRVSFDSKGGSKVSAQSVDDGKRVSKPSDPKRSGYKFAGWYGNAKLTKPYDFSAKVTSDLTLYAKWLKIHRVSFDSAGGTKVGAQRVVDGKKVSKPSDPTRKGYRFLGWYSNAKLTKAYDFSAPVKKNLTLHAKWQAEKTAPKNLLLKLRGTPGETSVTLFWDKVDGARSYVVYGTKCGKSTYHKIKVLPGSRGTATLKKVDGKKLKRGTYYKFYVLAKSGKAGKGKVLSESRRAHVATRGGRVGNFRKVTVNVPGKKLTLRVGESFQLEARAIPEGGGLKSHTHRKMPFESSNAKVAKVRASGEIIARAKGTAYIYAYAQNGVAARVKVTVK